MVADGKLHAKSTCDSGCIVEMRESRTPPVTMLEWLIDRLRNLEYLKLPQVVSISSVCYSHELQKKSHSYLYHTMNLPFLISSNRQPTRRSDF